MADDHNILTLDKIEIMLQEAQNIPAIDSEQMKDWALNRDIDAITNETLTAMSSVLIEHITERGGNINPSEDKLRLQLQSAIDRTEAAEQPDFTRSFATVLNVLSEKAGLSLEDLAEQTTAVQRQQAQEYVLDAVKQHLNIDHAEQEEALNTSSAQTVEEATVETVSDTDLQQQQYALLEDKIEFLNILKEKLMHDLDILVIDDVSQRTGNIENIAHNVTEQLMQYNEDSVVVANDIVSILQPIEVENAQQLIRDYEQQFIDDVIPDAIANVAEIDTELMRDLIQTARSHAPHESDEDLSMPDTKNKVISNLQDTLEQYNVISEQIQRSLELYADTAIDQQTEPLDVSHNVAEHVEQHTPDSRVYDVSQKKQGIEAEAAMQPVGVGR